MALKRSYSRALQHDEYSMLNMRTRKEHGCETYSLSVISIGSGKSVGNVLSEILDRLIASVVELVEQKQKDKAVNIKSSTREIDFVGRT